MKAALELSSKKNNNGLQNKLRPTEFHLIIYKK